MSTDSKVNALSSLNKLSEDVKKRDIFCVDPRIIIIEPGYNVRDVFDPEYWSRPEVVAYVRALADTYKQMYADKQSGETPRGNIDPICVLVRDGKVYLRGGEHRLRSALLAISEGANIKQLPTTEFKGSSTDEILYLLTSNNGKHLTPLQKAVLYERLRTEGNDGKGMSITEIANHPEVNKSHEHVRQSLILLTMPEELKGYIVSGAIAATQALKLFQESGDSAAEIVRQALAKKAALSESGSAATDKGNKQDGSATQKEHQALVKEDPKAPDDSDSVTKQDAGADVPADTASENAETAATVEPETTPAGNRKQARVTKATLNTEKKISPKTVISMRASFGMLSQKLASVNEANLPESFTLELSRSELEELLNLRNELSSNAGADKEDQRQEKTEEQLQLIND